MIKSETIWNRVRIMYREISPSFGRIHLLNHYFFSLLFLLIGNYNVQAQHILMPSERFQDIIQKGDNGCYYYELNHDIDLQGYTIEFPQSSILSFRGGRLKNGKIIGHGIFVDAPAYQIFESVDFNGTTSSSEVYPEWFGALADGIKDCTVPIRKAIQLGGEIKLSKGKYLIKEQLLISNSVRLKGCGSFDKFDNTRLVFANPNSEYAIKIEEEHNFNNGQMVSIEDLIIEPKNWEDHPGGGIDLTRPIYMKNVVVRRFKKTNLYVHHDYKSEGPYNSIIVGCKFMQSGEHGVVVGRGGNSMFFIGCMFLHNGTLKYNDVPRLIGKYDGLFVSGKDEDAYSKKVINSFGYIENQLYPRYAVENLTVIGGTSSHNSRYGWNFSDLFNSTVIIGYAESNFADKQMFIGNHVYNCNFLVNNIPLGSIERKGEYSKRKNLIVTQGRFFNSSNNDVFYNGMALCRMDNHISEPYNSKIVLMETKKGTISLVPDYDNNILSLQMSEGMNIDKSVLAKNVNSGKSCNSGTFSSRPKQSLSIGDSYFCIDRQTPEGNNLGMMIYYAGHDIWVDALGRIVK